MVNSETFTCCLRIIGHPQPSRGLTIAKDFTHLSTLLPLKYSQHGIDMVWSATYQNKCREIAEQFSQVWKKWNATAQYSKDRTRPSAVIQQLNIFPVSVCVKTSKVG